jgi:transposase
MDGLLEKEGRGRKKSLSEDEEKQVIEWLEGDGRSTNGLLGK